MNRAAVSLPNARPRAVRRPIDQRLIAIIDIGSNSVRLVVYRGAVRVPPTYLGAWDELPALHQAMWEIRLPEATGGAPKAVVNHALPESGLTSRDELLIAWAGPGNRRES